MTAFVASGTHWRAPETMNIPQETIAKIQHFSERRQKAEEESGHQPIDSIAVEEYDHRLDATLKSLQDQVKLQDDELQDVRQISQAKSRNKRSNIYYST